MKVLIRLAAAITVLIAACTWPIVWVFTGKDILWQILQWWEDKLKDLNKEK